MYCLEIVYSEPDNPDMIRIYIPDTKDFKVAEKLAIEKSIEYQKLHRKAVVEMLEYIGVYENGEVIGWTIKRGSELDKKMKEKVKSIKV